MAQQTTKAKQDSQTPKKRRSGQHPTPDEKQIAQSVFLEEFAKSANVTAACRQARIARSTLYQWQEHDEAFGLRYGQAELEANDVIRAAIFRRAIVGVDKPVIHQGRMATDTRGAPLTVKEYSDTLLIFLAKSRMPEFRDKQSVEVSGSLDVNSLAADADAKFGAYLAALTSGTVLVKPDTGTEG